MKSKSTLFWKFILLLLSAAVMPGMVPAARAQQTTDRAVVGGRIILNGSLKTVAVDARSAMPRQAAVMRTTLTQEELDGELPFMVSLSMRDLSRLHEREAAGETLTRAKLEADHLPAQADFDKVAGWLTSQGFTITRRDGHRLAVFAKGTIAQIQTAFQTRFAQVAFEGKPYVSMVAAPSVPVGLSAVLGVTGLQPFRQFHSFFHPPTTKPGFTTDTDNAPPYLVSEILGAFDAKNSGVTGAGETIGIIIDAVPESADVTKFYSLNNSSQSISNFKSEYVDDPPVAHDAPGGEEALDVEWSSTVAPGASTYLYCTGTFDYVNIDNAYSTVADELSNGDQPNLHQLSMSYGADEDELAGTSEITAEEQYFATIASYGVTILASSGDNGAFGSDGNLTVSYPASDVSITAVGGTTVVLNTSTGAVSSITGWSADGQGDFGNRIGSSGGGYSGVFDKPSWQKGTGVPGAAMRCVPDIAASSDQNEAGLLVLHYKGDQYTGPYANGTSWAAPTWAGLIALINEKRANNGLASLGMLGPKVYPLIGTSSFRDITVGSNGHHGESDGYSCTTGYDLVTGIGTPSFANLASKLAPAAVGAPTITSFSPMSGKVGDTVVIKGTNFVPPLSIEFAGNVFAAGNFTSTQITVTVPSGTQTGKITVAASGGSVSTVNNFTVTTASTPVITSGAALTVHAGQSFTYQIKATNTPTSYGVGGLFSGVTVNQQTGLISGTVKTAGTHSLDLRATNAAGTGHETLTLTVKEAIPIVNSATTATAYVGKAFSYQITATNSPTSYGVLGLFAGITVDKTTGKISGTPTAAGTHTLTLQAANSGGTGDETLTLTVYDVPAVTSAATLTAHVGKAFTYQITATEKPTSYGVGGLFSGVTVNQQTGLISGTVKATGTHSLDLRAINGAGTGHKTLTLTVAP